MLYATELLGANAYDNNGDFVGRVKELFIEPADQPSRVARVLLGRGRYRPLVARYDQLASAVPGRINLTTDEGALELYRPNEAWLAVRKDLLDQQIIDTNGRKVVRINDVDMSEQRTNGNVELRITHVDVGLAGAVRRLLQGVVPPSMVHRVQDKLPPNTIRWEYVNLIEPDPLRRVKLRMSSQALSKMHPADLAEIAEDLSPAERQSIIDSLPDEKAADTIAELDSRLQTQVMEKLEPGKAADIIEEMPPDEAADLLANLPSETSEGLLDEMEGEDAQEVRNLLQFEEDTAGGMMNTQIVMVALDATRGEVIDYIRFNEVEVEQLDTIVLIDRQGTLAGIVPVSRMILATREQPMSELAMTPTVSIHPDAKDRDVFELFDKYNLRSLTVVDHLNHPIGAITVDDVVSRLCAQV
ncbi:MAG: CBS domain-containing protein [Candidatus Acidiferrales bacterium]|jgi:magnesium transporter